MKLGCLLLKQTLLLVFYISSKGIDCEALPVYSELVQVVDVSFVLHGYDDLDFGKSRYVFAAFSFIRGLVEEKRIIWTMKIYHEQLHLMFETVQYGYKWKIRNGSVQFWEKNIITIPRAAGRFLYGNMNFQTKKWTKNVSIQFMWGTDLLNEGDSFLWYNWSIWSTGDEVDQQQSIMRTQDVIKAEALRSGLTFSPMKYLKESWVAFV